MRPELERIQPTEVANSELRSRDAAARLPHYRASTLASGHPTRNTQTRMGSFQQGSPI